MTNMSAASFEEFLAEAISTQAAEEGVDRPRVKSFEDAGMLTRDRGLVVKIGAAEYQVTIVKSR
jgi:hypothetical protein